MAATKKTALKQKKKTAPVPVKKTVKNKSSVAAKKAAVKPAAKLKSARPPVKKPSPVKKKEVRKEVAVAPRKPVKKDVKKDAKKVSKKDAYLKDRMKDLKASLLSKKADIVREAKEEIAKYISGENRQLVDTAVDEGDWATVDISEDINLMRLDVHRRLMRDIDEALRKINEGTYGICEECGEEISEKRLRVMPAATLCIACKENREQLEAVTREEIA
jgi:DnaK suppressor protein